MFTVKFVVGIQMNMDI